LLALNGYQQPGSYYTSPVLWHGHEMLFGYAAAVIAGFLLTAARNWTGVDTLHGPALAMLFLLWCLGRVLPLVNLPVPSGVIAITDGSFLFLLAAIVARPVLRTRQWRNIVFPILIAGLAVANLLFHLQLHAHQARPMIVPVFLATGIIILIISIMGARVIPFFTERGLPGVRIRRSRALEILAIASVAIYLLAGSYPGSGHLTAAAAAGAALSHGLLLFSWYQMRIWSTPLVWVLHTGFAWLVLGFALSALSVHGLIEPRLAMHAFTTGAIGVLTLGMMARVALGHTGRPLTPPAGMTAAFVLINLAALLRVLLPWVAPALLPTAMTASLLSWITAFVIFFVLYTPMLVSPRVDGRPG
jgi:uncharacterized protein involved in response to NO